MEQEVNQKGTSRVLRRKIINLMYLIFIVLAFLYIPSNFIDVFKDLNSTFEKSAKEFDNTLTANQLNNLYNFNTLLLNYLTTGPDVRAKEIKSKFDFVADHTDASIQKIEKIKESLVEEVGGFNEYGYLKNSKNYSATESILFEEKMADSLLVNLLSYKSAVKPKINDNCYNKVDGLIETRTVIESSSGEQKTWANYYFNKMPVSGAITVLSKFQNDLRKATNTIIEHYISFLSGDNDSLLVEVYNQDFNDVRAFVTKDGRINALIPDSSGKIRFFPYEEGKYVFTVYDKIRKLEKTFYVKDIGPVVQQPTLPVLYAGIDNRINVEHMEFPFERLKVTTTQGTVIKESGQFYLRMKSLGIAVVKVYGIDVDGEKLLATQKYQIEELPDLYASVGNRTNGEISAGKLHEQGQLRVSSDLAKDASFVIKTFKVKRIHKQSFKNTIEAETNRGGIFSQEISGLLKKAEAGDLYIFENIVVESRNKKQLEVPPVVLAVK